MTRARAHVFACKKKSARRTLISWSIVHVEQRGHIEGKEGPFNSFALNPTSVNWRSFAYALPLPPRPPLPSPFPVSFPFVARAPKYRPLSHYRGG